MAPDTDEDAAPELLHASFHLHTPPGRQTVPRAELCAAEFAYGAQQALEDRSDSQVSTGTTPLVSDAAYVIKGLSPDAIHARAQSVNGDLWQNIQALPVYRLGILESHKIKSHQTLADALEAGTVPLHWFGNYIADLLADHAGLLAQAQAIQIRWVSTWGKRAYHIVTRIAYIESLHVSNMSKEVPAPSFPALPPSISRSESRDRWEQLYRLSGHALVGFGKGKRCLFCQEWAAPPDLEGLLWERCPSRPSAVGARRPPAVDALGGGVPGLGAPNHDLDDPEGLSSPWEEDAEHGMLSLPGPSAAAMVSRARAATLIGQHRAALRERHKSNATNQKVGFKDWACKLPRMPSCTAVGSLNGAAPHPEWTQYLHTSHVLFTVGGIYFC